MQHGIIPMQLLMVLIGLMPKESGGERPVALTAMLYRLVMKLNKSNITQWDADKAEFWDTALKGSSCLRAALCRALKVEVATAQGFASVGLLWDLAAFFDSIRLLKLMKVGSFLLGSFLWPGRSTLESGLSKKGHMSATLSGLLAVRYWQAVDALSPLPELPYTKCLTLCIPLSDLATSIPMLTTARRSILERRRS